MEKAKFVGIVLAAGLSSRMGQLKPLLKLGNETLLQKLVNCYKAAGAERVFVVTGFQHEIIEKNTADAETVYNPDYEQGMITSIQAGLKRALDYEWDGVMFMPVDHAMVRPYMLKLMLNEFAVDEEQIIFPVYNLRRGHPPVVCRSVAEKLSVYDGERGAKRFLFSMPEIAKEVEVYSADLFTDMDTPEDYEKMKQVFSREVPTVEECYGMLKAEKTPQNVICHCEAVANKAKMLCADAKKAGYIIDDSLAFAGALLHDIKRTMPHHAAVGAEILRQNGFFRVARIIENHMDIDDSFVDNITEESIVYLADKLTKDDKYISLDDRLSSISGEKSKFAAEKLKKAQIIQKKITK